jgi:hypothetical protein
VDWSVSSCLAATGSISEDGTSNSECRVLVYMARAQLTRIAGFMNENPSSRKQIYERTNMQEHSR